MFVKVAETPGRLLFFLTDTFRTVVLGGDCHVHRMKGGYYIMPDINDPEYAVTPFPCFYMPWLPWPA